VLREEHAETLSSIVIVGLALALGGNYKEAEAMHRQTLALREKVLRHERPSTLTSKNNLAQVLNRQGKYEEAEAMHRQTLAWIEKVLGHEHPDTLGSEFCLAHLLSTTRRFNESLALYKRACAGYDPVLGRDHPTTRACYQHYASVQNTSLACVVSYNSREQRECTQRQRVKTAARASEDGHQELKAASETRIRNSVYSGFQNTRNT
jgi:tetratricopeptide (TPR) repeat protein